MTRPEGTLPEDELWMSRALRLARHGLPTTAPNPAVGCVLVRDGKPVGVGWHERAGGPHAEVVALAAAGGRSRGATAYVTLEPCCHHGRTPPCTEALVAAGVRRVVVAMRDPDPRVAGAGIAALEAAGIRVACGVLEDRAEALNRGYLHRQRLGRPWVTCKMGLSLDGRTAMASGESRWITSAESRRDVHRLRARCQAILTGIGTVLADDPALTVRTGVSEAPSERQPVRVVCDSRLRTPVDARICRAPGRTIIAHDASIDDVPDYPANIERLPVPRGPDDRLDLGVLLARLGTYGINDVLVEAGATLAGALLAAGLVDELRLYIAPRLLGSAARGAFDLPGLERLADAPGLVIVDSRAIGADWRLIARPLRAMGSTAATDEQEAACSRA